MKSKANFLGHPIHPMLIVFPLGLLGGSVIFDILATICAKPELYLVSYWMIMGGLVGGVLASVFGIIDWGAIPPGTRAKGIGAIHGLGNICVIVLFGASAAFREEPTAPTRLALWFSTIGIGFAFISGWLGGELVSRLGVGVHEGAHLNATNSLWGDDYSLFTENVDFTKHQAFAEQVSVEDTPPGAGATGF